MINFDQMEFSAEQIAQLLDGEIVGNPNQKVTGLSKIEEGKIGTLSFLSNPKYEPYIYDTNASLVIVNKTFKPSKALKDTCTLIKVEDAYACFAKLLSVYNEAIEKQPGIAETAVIAKSAKIGNNVYIGNHVVIENDAVIGDHTHIYSNSVVGDNVSIGNHVKLFPNVTVYRDCVIKDHCTIHAGAVIGADGFGFAPNSDNNYQKVPQIGNVILEEHVDIGANTCVDRATLGSTVIKKGVKLDNMVQIGHNVEIGDNTVVAAQTGIAGSAKLGKNMMVGGQVGIVGHISLADGTLIGAQSGVPKTIKKEGTMLLGSPAYDAEDYKKSYMGFRRLPQIMDRLKVLEEELKQLRESK